MKQSIKFSHVRARISKSACLEDINLTLEPDEHWAIIGANGSGKSSLGRLFCSELEVLAGEAQTVKSAQFVSFEQIIEILDFERANDDTDFLDRIDQGTAVREFILGDQAVGDDSALQDLAARMKFLPLLERGIRFLSTGEMRKVVICKALLQKPELLVLDEPFDGLDRTAVAMSQALIAEIIAKGIRVVLLLNRFSEILPEVSHLAYIKDCRILTAGPKALLGKSEALQRLHAFHYRLPQHFPAIDSATRAPQIPDGPLIEMRDLVVRYADKYILNQLSWTVNPGEHWIISGPNGAGKSTLLNMISGDNPQAYANDIRLFGRQKGSGESVWQIKAHIGLVSSTLQQNYGLRVTVKTVGLSGFYDSIGLYQKSTPKQEEIVLAWLGILQMAERADAPFRSLSYGEQRLVLLARAMVKQPRLLILDEPCQGLDDINRAMVLKLVDHLGQIGNSQILYVTHHPEDIIPCMTHSLRLVPAVEGGFCGVVEKL